MTTIPVVVLAGQSNASYGGVDNRLYELLTQQGSTAFEFVKVAVGGTSLFANSAPDWEPGSGELYARLVSDVQAAIQRVIAAGDTPEVHTLWIQGEQDTGRPTSDYAAQLTNFIDDYRGAIGQPQSDFAVTLLSYTSTTRTAQAEVAGALPGVRSIETWGYARIGAHYDKPGREGIAERFFEASGIHVPQGVAYADVHPGAVVTQWSTMTNVTGAPFLDTSWAQQGVKAAHVTTYSGDDSITGGPGNDTIATGDNADRVEGGAGDDSVNAGQHNDSVSGGAGDDRLLGDLGHDTLDGGDGRDYIRGGDHNDILYGGADFDDLQGNQGDDTVDGGQGDDWVLGGQGKDQLFGQDGRDILNGNLGNDVAEGGAGADTLRGGQGDDVVRGGDGDDWISGDLGSDTLAGGAGADTFSSFGGAKLDQILDFNPAEGDRLLLTEGAHFSVSQRGGDTVVEVDGDASVVLTGWTASALPDGWLVVG